jgi:nucleoside-diphosphate-sugar epimerase
MSHKNFIAEDIEFISNSLNQYKTELVEKSFLVSGATGLIGFTLVSALLEFEKKNNCCIKIFALVRNEEKAKMMYANELCNDCLTFVVADIRDKIKVDSPIDFVIHTANQTSSRAFVEEPVETIETAITGTRNILNFAKKKKSASVVFLSTMEVYGTPATDDKILETQGTTLNTMEVRSSYPESKRLCESLCKAYASEYSVPVKVIRLTQTFGPGVSYHDGRVFAEFARCVIEKRNIVLKTKGETKRNYLYTADAALAIFAVLLRGQIGEAYNAANEETYCSIYEMAHLVAEECAKNEIQVVVQEQDISKFGYAPVLKMNLDTSKLKALGWNPSKGLKEMFLRLIGSLEK